MTKLGEISCKLRVPTPLQLGLWPRAFSLLSHASKYYIHFSNMDFNETNKKYDDSISTYQNLFYEAQDKTILLYHN